MTDTCLLHVNSPGKACNKLLSLYTEPVYIPVAYSINNLHQVFPLPGKVYSIGGNFCSATVKNLRSPYSFLH